MGDLLDEMAKTRRAWTSETIVSWYPDDQLDQQLRLGLATEAGRVGDAAFGHEFRDLAAAGGPQDPLAWANRRFDLPAGGWAVAGPRFRRLDSSRPFVDVIATTEPPTPDGLAIVAAAVLPAYAAFAPLCLRVDAPDPEGLVELLARDPRFGPGSAVDMVVVAGAVERLRAHPRATAYPDVSLRAGDPSSLATRVSAIYDELGESQPGLAQWANPEDADSLAECAEEGLLFEVLADAEPAGVTAALRYDAHGMTGFSVQELCLDSRHRGRRLAPAVVQRLTDELPARAGDVLWGTIHPANRPSLRNALSIGRVPVGGYVWVTPAGLPGMPSTT
jgi:hypothetical protein